MNTAPNLPPLPEVSREFLVTQSVLNRMYRHMPVSVAVDGMVWNLEWCGARFWIDDNEVPPYFVEEVSAEYDALLNQYQEAQEGRGMG